MSERKSFKEAQYIKTELRAKLLWLNGRSWGRELVVVVVVEGPLLGPIPAASEAAWRTEWKWRGDVGMGGASKLELSW